MDLIFANGEELYNKENLSHKTFLDHIHEAYKMNQYQECILKQILNQNEKHYNIYGDDFKIEITPTNMNGDCVLSIRDYDEKQKFESEISIGFSKDELDQLITLLQTVRGRM